MCGIAYCKTFDGSNASNRILKQVKRQKHRGMQSFGFALPDKHVMNWRIKYEEIAAELRRTTNPEILFHQRLSTSTANRPTACHPFSTKDTFDTEFVGVHNGIVWNEHELYELHKERFGIRYVSDNGKDFNDSEAYIYDLASYFTGKIDGIEMNGYGAFVVIEYNKETHEPITLHWGTTDPSSAPLRVHHNQQHLSISSEGKGWLVEKDTHYTYDYATGDITFTPLVHSANKVRSKYSPYYGSSASSRSYYPYSDDTDYTPPKNSTVSDYDMACIAEENEAIIAVLNKEFPLEGGRKHYGYSFFPDGCCETCDELLWNGEDWDTSAINAQREKEKRTTNLSVEFQAVQKMIEQQEQKRLQGVL